MLFRSTDKLIPGGIDVYSWAMCFYTTILGRNQTELSNELEVYKLGTEENYNNFLKSMNNSINDIKVTDPKDKRKKEFIAEELKKALTFKAEKRPTINEIFNHMNDFEKKSKIYLPYFKMEKDFKQILADTLMIEIKPGDDNSSAAIKANEKKLQNLIAEITKKTAEINEMKNNIKKYKRKLTKLQTELDDNSKKFVKNEEVEDVVLKESCQICVNNKNNKAKFSCKHTVCKNCILQYSVKKFMNNEPYRYHGFCSVCKKLAKIGNLYHKQRKHYFGLWMSMESNWPKIKECDFI